MEIEFESEECYSSRNLSNWYPIPGKRTVVRNDSVQANVCMQVSTTIYRAISR